MANCTKLAASLSNNYLNAAPFNSSSSDSSITNYLTKHGILLTMCMPFSCTVPFSANHVAASWINQRIGLKVIPTLTNIGLILEPSKVKINCLYPTDAGTDGRDNDGCGPYQMDPTKGSKGASSYNAVTRQIVRWKLTSYKNLNFGRNTAWENISCNGFFGLSPNGGDGLSRGICWKFAETHNFDDLSYQPFVSLLQDEHEAIMGHKVCTVEDPEPHFGPENWLEYSGATSFSPAEFQAVIDLQVHLSERAPSTYIWNEITIALPKQMQDIVLAVFYVDMPEIDADAKKYLEERAEAEAKMLGNKPVLKAEVTSSRAGKALLECVQEENSATTDNLIGKNTLAKNGGDDGKPSLRKNQ